MKKIILILSILSVFILSGCNLTRYAIKLPGDVYFSQQNYFDPYEDVEVVGGSVEDLEIVGLELLGLRDCRITQFGSFTLRYCLYIDGVLVVHQYRTIKVGYERIPNGLIYNGDFLGGLNEWGIIDWKKSLEVDTEEDHLKITQKSVDEYIWDQSIYQYISDEDNHLEINKKYIISFDASSTNNKVIKVCLAQALSDNPYSYNVMNEHDIEITNELKTYTIEFTAVEPSNIVGEFEFNIRHVRLEFKFGKYNNFNNETSTIIFDNIFIKEI